MKVMVNGQSTDYSGDATLESLINELYPDAGKVAVAVNQEFVPRSTYETTEINDGDDIEIVAPMQGG